MNSFARALVADHAPRVGDGNGDRDGDGDGPKRVDGLVGARIPAISAALFCDSPDLLSALDGAAGDRRMAKARVQGHKGGIAAAKKRYRVEQSPDLLLVEVRSDGEALLAEVDALAAVCDPKTKVILAGGPNDIDLYRALMHRGVSEYLCTPVSSGAIISAIARIYTDPEAATAGRSYAFIGTRGGVGSSTLAHNVAAVLGRSEGKAVIIADLDLFCGTGALDFDVQPERGIGDALREHERLDEQMLERMLFPVGEHLHLLASPAALDPTIDVQPDALEKVLQAAQASAAHVVLDLPHVLAEWSWAALLSADQVVITATPDLASLRNASKLVDMIRKGRRHDAEPVIVLNQVGIPKRLEISAAKFAESVGLKPLLSVPFDPQGFGTAANAGRVIVDTPAGRRHRANFRRLADVLVDRPLKSRRFGAMRRLIDFLAGSKAVRHATVS